MISIIRRRFVGVSSHLCMRPLDGLQGRIANTSRDVCVSKLQRFYLNRPGEDNNVIGNPTRVRDTTRSVASSAVPAKKVIDTASASETDIARSLIDDWRYILGSWSDEQCEKAKDILPKVAPELAFALYHRIMNEMNFTGTISPISYCTSRFYIPILQAWRDAYISHYRRQSQDPPGTFDAAMPHPNDVFQMLRTLSKIPGFEATPIAISLVLSVVVATSTNRADTPFVLQDLIIANALPEHRNHTHLVGQLMQAWAVSGRPYRDVSRRLDQLLQSVESPNLALFNTAIHYYSRNVEMEKVEQLLDQMKKLDMPCDGSTTLNHLAHGYAQTGQLKAAYDALVAMVDLDSTTEDQMMACATGVLDACRRRVRSARKKRHVSADVECAEKISALIRTRVDGPSRNRILCMMIDLYGFVGDYDMAERTFLDIPNPDTIQYSTMIKACGLNKDLAKTKIWFSRLVDSGLELDIRAFNTFINALASTSDGGAVALAHDVINSLDIDSRFQNLRPNLMTYNSLLKCISVSGDLDAGDQASKVLEEMEEKGFIPDHISFSFCYKACVESADYARSDEILRRIGMLRPAPSIKFFNSLLDEWANVGTEQSVNKLEEVVQWMHKAAKTNPSLRPNVFTYGILVKALTLLNGNDGPRKISDIFATMDKNNVKPDRAILGTAVLYLSSQEDTESVMQSASLLRRIEDMDHFHLCEVVHHLLRVDAADEVVALISDVLGKLESRKGKVGIWTKTIRRILTVLARQGLRQEASDVLQIAERFEKQRKEDSFLSPDCYDVVIKAWQASDDPDREVYLELHKKSKLERLGNA